MITKEEVQKIAKLARLELTNQEIEKMQKDMAAVLQYFKILQKVKSSKLKVKSKNALNTEQVTRRDKAEARPASLANNLIAAAPDKKDDYIKVKSIL